TKKISDAKVAVDQKLDQSQEDLKVTNAELVKALDVATERAEEAKRAQQHAEENARLAEKSQKEAVASREVAVKAEAQAQAAYQKEHDRAERLQKEIGTSIDTLKK